MFNDIPVINSLPISNVYTTNRFFTDNPNLSLLPVRTVSEIDNLYISSRFIKYKSTIYFLYTEPYIY